MKNKIFLDRLHQQLDEIGLPEPADKRTTAFATLIHQPRSKAEAILSGLTYPDQVLLEQLAEEFEVSVAWLLGEES